MSHVTLTYGDAATIDGKISPVLQCVAVCCGVLRCVAVCCGVLQCVAVCCSVLMLLFLLPAVDQHDNMGWLRLVGSLKL